MKLEVETSANQVRAWAGQHADCTTVIGALMWVTVACTLVTAATSILSAAAFVAAGVLTGLMAAISVGGVVLGMILAGTACGACALTAGAAMMLMTSWTAKMGAELALKVLQMLSPDLHARLLEVLLSITPAPLLRIVVGAGPRRALPPAVEKEGYSEAQSDTLVGTATSALAAAAEKLPTSSDPPPAPASPQPATANQTHVAAAGKPPSADAKVPTLPALPASPAVQVA